MTPERTIERLCLYRRQLEQLQGEGKSNVYSHELARRASVSAAQVRRDFMAIGYSGSPAHGYDISELLKSIAGSIDSAESEHVAIVGIGNLGRAILAHFAGRRPKLRIEAAFDADPSKHGRVIHGCRCFPMSDFHKIVKEQHIRVGIIAVPGQDAQTVCESMVGAGIRGVLNFAPTALHAPEGVHVEAIDMAMSLEKVAYFARQGSAEKE